MESSTRRRDGGSFYRSSSGCIIYVITAVAETNRTPFDLVEAETELVGGFHTEYSGLRFGLFFIAEYVNMLTVSCLATLLFFGGWNAPFGWTAIPGIGWFVIKVGVLHVLLYVDPSDAAAPALRSAHGLRLEGVAARGHAQSGRDGDRGRVQRMKAPVSTRKQLLNVGAILRGLSITFGFMFRRRPTIQYPSVKKQHAPRFHGLHELRRYSDGKERCIGCELCSSVCPANAITVIGAENSPTIGARRASGMPRVTRSTSCGASSAACAKRRVRPTRSS